MRERFLTLRQPRASLVMAGVTDVVNRPRPVPSTLPQWWRCEVHGHRSLNRLSCLLRNAPGRRNPDVHDIVADGPFPFRLWVHAGGRYDSRGYQRALRSFLAVWDHGEGSVPWSPMGFLLGASGDPGVAASAGFARGALLGSVTVTGCHHADECGRHPGCTCPMTGDAPAWHHDECASHDDSIRWHCSPWAEPDAYHITLADPRPLREPIPMRGAQGWPYLPDDIRAEALAQLEGVGV